MARLNEILGYEVLGTLGHGARSTIYAVRDDDHNVFALKHVVKLSPSDQRFLDQAILEHQISSQFTHPTLRRSFKIIRQRKLIRTSEIYILMEMVDGLTLEQHHVANLIELCRLCQQVALGLGQMHEEGFVHADIKPNNIMVTDRLAVKIIDFGQSCAVGTVKTRIQGTPDYIAPEQVLRRRITPRTDVFNLGATMYWLLTGKHVPTLMPRGKAGLDFRTEKTCPPPRDLRPEIPPALSSLVMNCIETSPYERPESMVRVYDRLEMSIQQLIRERDNGGPIAAAAQRRSAV